MLNRSYWTNRRVFLTGHTGFKGSWLSLWLGALGAKVTGYSLEPPTKPSLFAQAHVADGLRSMQGDIRDFQRLKDALAETRPDVVLHLAAQSVVRRGYADPIETYSSNVMGTVNLFEALRQLQRPAVVVNVTSDKCYENREWVWGYRESDPLGGHDPYSNSKACAELVTSAFRDSFFRAASSPKILIATARAGNVIGGGDWTADQLIPDLMRAFLSGTPCAIRNPMAVRPWQFVLEPLRGYLKLAERLDGSNGSGCIDGAWNFGPADVDAKPVSWIASELGRLWPGNPGWIQDPGSHPREAHWLKLDTSKADMELDWRPGLTLAPALEWIVDWYRAFQAGGDLARLTKEQIERYEAQLGADDRGAVASST